MKRSTPWGDWCRVNPYRSVILTGVFIALVLIASPWYHIESDTMLAVFTAVLLSQLVSLLIHLGLFPDGDF